MVLGYYWGEYVPDREILWMEIILRNRSNFYLFLFEFQSDTELMANSNNLFIFFSSELGFHWFGWFFLLNKEINNWGLNNYIYMCVCVFI